MKNLGGIFDPDALKKDIDQLEGVTSLPDFWNERERAEKTLTRLKRIRGKYEPWMALQEDVEEIKELFTLAEEEKDESLEAEIATQLEGIRNRHDQLKLVELLGDKFDDNSAFLTIHSGAGGTEACDWVSMLLRMYSRWAERKGYRTEILDLVEAEGGVKSITLQISGDYGFGNLRGETGIHRLVRISPFDSRAPGHF